jgi:hypothetical protein
MTTATYALAVMILAGLLGFWGLINLKKELKASHPSEWEKLASPPAFSVASIRHEFRWIEFILLRRYTRLGSPRVILFGNVVLACSLVSVAILIAWAFIPHGPAPLG